MNTIVREYLDKMLEEKDFGSTEKRVVDAIQEDLKLFITNAEAKRILKYVCGRV